MREAMSFGEKVKKGLGFFLMCFGVSSSQKAKPKPAVAKPETPK
jgi:hypothetical protein